MKNSGKHSLFLIESFELMLTDSFNVPFSESQTFVALDQINVKRRVILSGTPIQVRLYLSCFEMKSRPILTKRMSFFLYLLQNDLTEYFSLLNFANPSLLGNRLEFRKNYELAILKGRDSLASDKQQELGNQKLKELSAVASKFIIRRTNDLLSKYRKFRHLLSLSDALLSHISIFFSLFSILLTPLQFQSSTSTSSFAVSRLSN